MLEDAESMFERTLLENIQERVSEKMFLISEDVRTSELDNMSYFNSAALIW